MHCAALPDLGLGIAIKCDDGAGRAADLACATLVAQMLDADVPEALLRPDLSNWNGIAVGAVRPAGPLAA